MEKPIQSNIIIEANESEDPNNIYNFFQSRVD